MESIEFKIFDFLFILNQTQKNNWKTKIKNISIFYYINYKVDIRETSMKNILISLIYQKIFYFKVS